MIPEAPVRFSTMNCCFRESVSLAANRRASGSTEPPGGYGETNLTTFVGQSCAKPGSEMQSRKRNLKTHIPSSFELQHLSCIVRRCDHKAELLEDAARLGDLLGVRFRELPAPEPQAVLQADAHVAAHHRAHRGGEHLVAAGAQHRPAKPVAEQPGPAALHVQHV